MLIVSLGAFVTIALLLLYATRGTIRIAAVALCVVGGIAVAWAFARQRDDERAKSEKIHDACHSLANWLDTTAELYDRHDSQIAKAMLDGIRQLVPAVGALCVPDPYACSVTDARGEFPSGATRALVKPVSDALRAGRACPSKLTN